VRVALDTNVLIGAIGTRGLCADLMRLVLRDHELVVGERVLLELKRNLTKKLRMSPDVVEGYDAFLRAQAAAVPSAARTDVDGLDAGDAQVLADAVAGSAEVLVTGDRDLQAMGAHAPLPIISPRQLWESLRPRT
jgi:putative PIN family toxin of toxin-antitoxin system